jgi:hypothetical protein
MQNNDDILSAFDLVEDTKQEEIVVPTPIVDDSNAIASSQVAAKKTFTSRVRNTFILLIKYFSTSICIFGILMVGANYSAYWNLAYSIIYAEEMQVTKNSLIQSVAANNLEEKNKNVSDVNTFKQVSRQQEYSQKTTRSMHSMSSLTSHPSQS